MSHAVRRALISVYDKQEVVPFARALHARGIEILSSGGTAELLARAGIPVIAVSDYTGFPELLDGRVKTLHPRIHAGILAARENPDHMADLERHGIGAIDLVVVNLYPFQRTVAQDDVTVAQAVEMIDIGGPTMVRAAAKNHAHVGVVVRPQDYPVVQREVAERGGLSDATRLELAATAFRHVGEYDAAVASYLGGLATAGTGERAARPFPPRLALEFVRAQELRYGENPHQRAALYRDPLYVGAAIGPVSQLQGKELSFNNILDLDAALGVVADLDAIACAIVKHGNPCGVALGGGPREAFACAAECDPVSAFGGVVAFNAPVDGRAAEALAELFLEAIVAPRFAVEARDLLSIKKNLRLLEVGELTADGASGFDLRRVRGGLLVQEWDRISERVRDGRVVTRRAPTDDEWRALEFAWVVARHVKSNAIVYAAPDRTLGIGAGQMSRVDSARLAVEKARSPLAGAAMASDAFFPFRDGLDVPAQAGIRAVVQPGGSVRDAEVIEAADEHGMAMVLTGRRHFRH